MPALEGLEVSYRSTRAGKRPEAPSSLASWEEPVPGTVWGIHKQLQTRVLTGLALAVPQTCDVTLAGPHGKRLGAQAKI